MPTFNERENIALLVPQLLAIAGLNVLIVDDGSPDGTGAAADRLAEASGGRLRVMHRTGARGLGRSYVDGMQGAVLTNVRYVCQMDADLSHDPIDLVRLIRAGAGADLVIGSRYVPGGALHNWPRRRVWLSAVANWYVRGVTGLRVRDCTSGFRCWRRDLLARLPLAQIASDGYAFQVEMAYKAWRAGATIVEAPITFVERRQGSSKLSGRVIAESIWMPWRLIARKTVRRRPD
ncbi:MAG TPA: polyprenol monophosphomannose synthase [Vicinamibacterales bacterium]|nr:polyprenol monophosphomannose synthase [Vicinamibacterales bacterium]